MLSKCNDQSRGDVRKGVFSESGIWSQAGAYERGGGLKKVLGENEVETAGHVQYHYCFLQGHKGAFLPET